MGSTVWNCTTNDNPCMCEMQATACVFAFVYINTACASCLAICKMQTYHLMRSVTGWRTNGFATMWFVIVAVMIAHFVANTPNSSILHGILSLSLSLLSFGVSYIDSFIQLVVVRVFCSLRFLPFDIVALFNTHTHVHASAHERTRRWSVRGVLQSMEFVGVVIWTRVLYEVLLSSSKYAVEKGNNEKFSVNVRRALLQPAP